MKNFIYLYLFLVIVIYSIFYDLNMLQQNSYNDNNHYTHFAKSDLLKNYKINLIKVLLILCFIFFSKFNIWEYLLVLFFLIIDSILCYVKYYKHSIKLPLKYTKRMIRIIILDAIIFFLSLVVAQKDTIIDLMFAGILYSLIHPVILILIIILLKPIEKYIFNGYKKKAMNKLERMNNIKKIGITGSFGKTSTKMILNSILSSHFKGFYTPASFNTPNGILITINNENSIFNDYFIAEMGAKNVGEIKELCDIVYPKYGILTSIGPAHLETFKSLENICKTKFELIESLPEDGIAVLNKDDKLMREYKLKSKVKVVWVGIENKADVMASNISVTSEGTKFDVIFKDKHKLSLETILLGNKNIYNILASVALAHELGVPDQKIITGVKNIAPINHRLEIKHQNSMTVIDDAFNSNPEGAKMALEVLSLMPGKKVIITPGMIEMGDEEYNLNREFGKKIAAVADEVYLIGKKQTKPIYDGLIAEKYSENNIKVYNNFKEAFNEITRKYKSMRASVLIENDLPDSYTEE